MVAVEIKPPWKRAQAQLVMKVEGKEEEGDEEEALLQQVQSTDKLEAGESSERRI